MSKEGVGCIAMIDVVLAAFFGLVMFFSLYRIVAPGDEMWGFSTDFTQKPLKMLGRSGDEVKFYVSVNSINGLWSAPEGLTLTLTKPDSDLRLSQQVVPPAKHSWGEFIAVSHIAHSGIEATFKIPPLAGSEALLLQGRLKGRIDYPTGEGRHYWNTSVEMDVPVELKVVSPSTFKVLRESGRRPFWRIFFGALVFLVWGFGQYAWVADLPEQEFDSHRLRRVIQTVLVLIYIPLAVWWFWSVRSEFVKHEARLTAPQPRPDSAIHSPSSRCSGGPRGRRGRVA